MSTISELADPRGSGCSATRCTALLGVLLVLSAAPLNVSAWGADGHRLIAEVAQMQLSAPTGAEIDRLLTLEPGATLASISTWADETRSASTARWHYVNLPRDADCTYEPERSCAQGGCVVGAIEQQVALLASTAPDAQRLTALKYVVHLVADVHQPLHAGFKEDRGGNTYQLQVDGRGTNLHALWDTTLIRQWPGGIAALRTTVAADQTAVDVRSAPAAWAQASCRIVSSDGFYPSGHTLPDDYARRWNVTLVRQLAAAARRLAAVLEQALGQR